MKTEELLLIGLGAYLVLQSQKKSTGNAVTPIPNSGVPSTNPSGGMANTPQGVLDQVVAIGGQIWDSITSGSDTTPVFSTGQVGPSAAGSSFDPGDPGSNRMIAPMGFRSGASAVSATAVSNGVPGSAGPPSPTTRAKSPAGTLPYSPFSWV